MASQKRLMWWKFKRHKLALVSGIFLLLLYFMILIAEFLAPYDLHTRNVDFIHSPPQGSISSTRASSSDPSSTAAR